MSETARDGNGVIHLLEMTPGGNGSYDPATGTQHLLPSQCRAKCGASLITWGNEPGYRMAPRVCPECFPRGPKP